MSGITQNTQQAAAMLQRQMNMAVQQQPTQQTTGTTGIWEKLSPALDMISTLQQCEGLNFF